VNVAFTRCRALLIALLGVSHTIAATLAAPVSSSHVIGDWETTRVLVVDVGRDSPGGINPDDGREVGRKYSFQATSAVVDGESTACALNITMARQAFSINTLFAGERLARSKLVRQRLYGRAAEYDLASLSREPVTIYAYQCKVRGTQLNPMGNWFAATKDTVIWPLGLGALAVMKRPPAGRPAAQLAFCAAATRASDKTICEDRELWLMKTYTETVDACAIVERGSRTLEERRGQLDSYITQRNRCAGERSCIFYALREHAAILGQSVPSVAECVKATKK
jgi:hypothetical protein